MCLDFNGRRQFKAPIFNFDADSYLDLVRWESVKLERCDPPLLHVVSDDELLEAIENPDALKPYMQFPCHSQATERQVQEVHKSVDKATDPDERDGLVRSKRVSRRKVPSLQNKKFFLSTKP